MNSKALFATVLVLALLGGFLYFRNNQSQQMETLPQREATAPVVDQVPTGSNDAMMEDDAMMEENGGMEDESVMEDGAMMEKADVTVEVEGGKFYFTPEEITVTEGDTVKIVFNNVDGTHDWVIDEFDARTETINTGETDEVTFVADQAGTFEYYCSVGNHRELGMVGSLIVEPAQ
jgi:plastocyanin